MTARTALTPVQKSTNGSVALGAGTAIAGLVAAGVTIASPPGPNGISFQVANSDTAAHTFTVRAGGSGASAAGGTNTPVPFTQATQGDLAFSVPASSTVIVGPFETDRVTQADGSLSADFSAGFTGTVWAVREPSHGIVIAS